MTFAEALKCKKFELEDQHAQEVDLHLAAAALMFEVIAADGDIDRMEVANLVEILRRRYGLSSSEIAKVLSAARNAVENEQEIDTFTRRLCAHWSATERTQLLNDFWHLATADHHIDDGERNKIAEIAQHLKLDEEEVLRARYMAEQRLELNIC